VVATPARPAPRPAPTAPAATTPAPRPATTPAPKPAAALDAPQLHAVLERLSGADHFEALGVKRDAPAAQIKVAYFQLAKLYHPDAIPPSAPAEVRKLAADVFGRVSEAWGVLGDEAQRAQYLQELLGGGAPSVDVMNILQAENAFQAGALLVKGRRYDEAIARFEDAMKLNPEEAEFAMWKAWCEYLLADDRKRQLGTSAATIEAGLKKNPRCAQGHLFLGQMAKLAGDLGNAEKHLRRGLAVAPDHAELLRELKYLRK
jgi:tetratricopeptide (TPR) repeat protein